MTPEKKQNWKCKLCLSKVQNEENNGSTSPSTSSNIKKTTNVSKIPKSSTPSDNVTQRKHYTINISTENSFESLNSDDTETDIYNMTEMRINSSCPDLNIINGQTIDELKNKIKILEEKLKVSDRMLEKYLIENGTLKSKLVEYEQKISRLTDICKATPIRRGIRRQNLNVTKLNLSMGDEKQIENTVTEQSSISSKEYENEENLKSTNANGNKSTVDNLEPTCDKKNKSLPHPSYTKEDNNIIAKKKIMLLCDEKGKGFRNIIQKLIGNEFEIISIIKPNSSLYETIMYCDRLCKDFTNQDYIIILSGSNDQCPLNFQSSLYCGISLLANTNVLVGEIYENNYINVFKQNKLIQLVCSQFSYSSYVSTFTNRVVKFTSYRFLLCKLIAREILRIKYKVDYENYSTKSLKIDNENLCDKITNTNMTNMVNKSQKLITNYFKITNKILFTNTKNTVEKSQKLITNYFKTTKKTLLTTYDIPKQIEINKEKTININNVPSQETDFFRGQ